MRATLNPHMKAARYVLLILTLISLFAPSGCGGGEDGDEMTQPPAATDTQPPAEQPTSPPEATAAPLPAQQQPVERAIDGVVMVHVPAGEFLMGSDESPFPPERPGHLVTLDDYWIDRTEVNNAQYRRCVEAGVCAEPKPWEDSNLNGDDQPALVLWEGARTYCEWVGGRLPTEAEWEKAARGTDGRLWPWGQEFEPGRANLSGEEDGYGYTAPVGSFPGGASPYGLLDMAGNAAEWVADWYDPEYYTRSPGQNPPGPASGEQKLVRGTTANAGGGPEKCRCVARYPQDPARWEFGFRCVTTAPPEGGAAKSTAGQSVSGGEGTAQQSTTAQAAGLDSLDTYRMRLLIGTASAADSAGGFEQTMEIEWNRASGTRRIVMDNPAGGDTMELITIGDTTWTKLAETWIQSESAQDQPWSSPSGDLDDLLGSLQGGMTLLGEETVNGVNCQHYAVDSQVSVEVPDTSTGAAQTVSAHVKGELWQAAQSGLPPVVIRSKTETTMTGLAGGVVTIYEERDVYDINAPITIEPPQ